jgi:phosphoglucosamine mutase
MRKLFGTDGIRGVAGQYPLDKPTVFAIGAALAHHLTPECSDSGHKDPSGAIRVIIGQDTRESSKWISETLAAGLQSAGALVWSAGVVPTPAIAHIARVQKFCAGVVVSASHNPWQDNGIKIFGGDGYKLADKTELEIEEEIFARAANPPVETNIKELKVDSVFEKQYVEWLAKFAENVDRSKLNVVVDCANGAAYLAAQDLFAQLKLKATFLNVAPDGRNINENCGALHPEIVAKEVIARGADLGICFDGDADRALFADHTGKVVNGDAVLYLAAREMRERGALKADTVVATTMSNMGLEAAFNLDGIKMLRAPVGDKYVLEEMRKRGATLGGEQSGHVIFSDLATTGDGLLTALEVLKVVSSSGQSLAALTAGLKVFPQVIKNVKVREKKPLEQLPEVMSAIKSAEADLNGTGRVVVRYSGTESLCRVMIEAESQEKMDHHVERIVYEIRSTIGN